MAVSLLDQALATTERRAFLRNLTPAQVAKLQGQIHERAKTLPKIDPAALPKPKPAKPKSVVSANVLRSMKTVRVGRHKILLPSTAKYHRLRDAQVVSYYRGVVNLWRVRSGKVVSQPLKPEDRQYLARTYFGIRS